MSQVAALSFVHGSAPIPDQTFFTINDLVQDYPKANSTDVGVKEEGTG